MAAAGRNPLRVKRCSAGSRQLTGLPYTARGASKWLVSVCKVCEKLMPCRTLSLQDNQGEAAVCKGRSANRVAHRPPAQRCLERQSACTAGLAASINMKGEILLRTQEGSIHLVDRHRGQSRTGGVLRTLWSVHAFLLCSATLSPPKLVILRYILGLYRESWKIKWKLQEFLLRLCWEKIV